MKTLRHGAALAALAIFALSGAAHAAPVEGAQPEPSLAESPAAAVNALVRAAVGGEHPVRVRASAFEGLPAPASGIRFAARAVGIDEAGLRLTVSVEARTRRGVIARRTYVFPWEVEEPVVVPRRVIRAGDTIRTEDLEVKSLPIGGGFERYALTMDELVGRTARRTLLAGRPVASRLVERPAAVERGASVTVRVHVGPMVVTMDGEAMEAGAVGESVKVLNPSSKRVLSGRVVDHGTIEVMR